MSQLASERCDPCRTGDPPLTTQEAMSLHAMVAGWDLQANQLLRRTYAFGDFSEAFGFATRIALLAESQGHHPDLAVSWGKVEVSLTTHSVSGLSRNDFIMASKIDALRSG